ncbi:MAG: serine hydrolase, partial [Saprospiraceae bacterium]|nr:serine hydrolase [Saprospiraceae bacterium]
MKKVILLLVSFLIISNINSQSDDRLTGIEDDLNKVLEATKAAGFSVAVIEKDKLVYSKGFGYRDYENKIPADANTLYAIGSSTKAFTSAILGQLRNDEKLSFDDSPIKHIPELRFFNDEMNDQIIISDLMSHRTGLPRHDLSWYLFPTFDKDSLMARIQYQEPFAGVREQWYYNNFMFLAQGVIAEKVTGKSWEDNIRERFLAPLNMTRTNVTIDELLESENAAFGYELENDSIISKMDYYRIAAMRPAGSINSSVNDMANWLKVWINNGKFNEEEILPEPYLKEAMSSQMVVSSGMPDDEFPDMHLSNYGYGWFISSYRGHYRVQHGGNIDGFSANVAFFPTDSIGIVVLANQNGSAVPGMVRNIVADRMLNAEKTDWAQRFIDRQEEARKEAEEAEEDTPSNKVENTTPSHSLVEYIGKYNHPGYGEFDIEMVNDSLQAKFKLMTLYLKHYHYDVFEPFEITETGVDTTAGLPLRFNFLTNEIGDISGAQLKAEPAIDGHIVFKRTPSSIDVEKGTLERYVGEFALGAIEIKVYTKNDKTLYLFVQGQ